MSFGYWIDCFGNVAIRCCFSFLERLVGVELRLLTKCLKFELSIAEDCPEESRKREGSFDGQCSLDCNLHCLSSFRFGSSLGSRDYACHHVVIDSIQCRWDFFVIRDPFRREYSGLKVHIRHLQFLQPDLFFRFDLRKTVSYLFLSFH